MKKFKAVMFAFVLAGMTMVSCSSDDSSGPAPTIDGKWNQTKTVTKVGTASPQSQKYNDDEPGCSKDFVEFVGLDEGTLKKVIYFKDAQNDCQQDQGPETLWSISDDNLSISDGEFIGNYTITKLTGSELIITGTLTALDINITYYFKRASN